MTATQAPTPGPLSASDIAHVRDYWSAICDSDWHLIPANIRDDLEERLAAVGLAEWRAVTDDDLEDTFAYERGIEKGRSCLDLTALGHLAFKSDADGWMPWSGGDPTITDPTVDIEVRLRNGELHVDRSPAFDWTYDPEPHPFDIIAFRLAPTAPVEASGLERDYTDAEILGDTVPADLLDGEIVAFGLRMEGTAGLYPSIRNTQEGAAKLAARLAEESPENPPYIPVALSLRPQPSGQPSGFIATLTDDQRAETLAYTGDDTHPQPSGETREHGPKCWGKTSLSDEMAHCYCGSTDLRPQPSGETREQCAACSRGEVTHFSTDDGFWVEITTSAGGANEHGLNGWFETLEHYPDSSTKRREYVATDSPALSATPARSETQDEDTPCTDCGDTGVTHQTERRCSCREAEAQDEGAAGERLLAFADDVAAMSVAIAVSNYTGALADDIRSVLDRTHPSPTPAADADRVLREAGWSVAVHNDYRLNGEAHTFWLWTHPDGRWIKGEGRTDEDALSQCAALIRPAPVASGGQHSSATDFPPDDVLACVPVADAVALSASDRACYEYPGIDQTKERAAFVAGAMASAPAAETAGEAVAWQWRHGDDMEWHTSGVRHAWFDDEALNPRFRLRPLYAAPAPAQDDDKLRRAVEALEKARDRINVTRGPMGSFYRTESSAEALYEAKVAVGIGLSALKSTAAKEGGE